MTRLTLALLVTLTLATPASACHRRPCRHRHRPAAVCRVVRAAPVPAGATYSMPVIPAPAVRPTPQAGVQAVGDGPGAFLALLNLERARNGRGPLQWSHRLAAFAAMNQSIHSPGSSGGAGQAWAGTTSYTHAFTMWMSSPGHRTILLNAVTEVGVSPSALGMTANAH